jgi:uncharacterized protein YbaA (DUF1428 family)
MPAIETHSLTTRFGNTTAVDAIGLSVPEGTIYGYRIAVNLSSVRLFGAEQ